jgi:hypothetical protein
MNPAENLEDKRCRRQFDQCKRKYRRTDIAGFVGNLVDGKKVIGGIVGNISTGGFAFTNLPQSFSAEKHTYVAILSGRDKHYKMLAKPCWRTKNDPNTITIGFKILDAPWEWVEFTMNQLAEMRDN